MCTVAVVRSVAGGYRLGQNRDERRERARARPPRIVEEGGRSAVAPFDPDGGGSWIAVNDAGLTLSLLNGPQPDAPSPSRTPRSRGLIIRDLMYCESIDALRRAFRAGLSGHAGMRPFELVAVEPPSSGDAPTVARCVWTGVEARWETHTPPCLFVSSSLDPEPAARARAASWRRFLAGAPSDPDADALRIWLGSHDPERGSTSVCMHRSDAATVSRTLVSVDAESVSVDYTDGAPCRSTERTETVLRRRVSR